jgi:hypothetical protein
MNGRQLAARKRLMVKGTAVRSSRPLIVNRGSIRKLAAFIATCLLLIGIAACTGRSNKGSTSSAGLAQSNQGAAAGDSARTDALSGLARRPALAAAPSDSPTTSTPLQQKDFVRTAAIQLRVADVDQAADAILARAARVSGQVQSDRRTTDGDRRNASLVLRLPPDRLDEMLTATVKLGKELDRTLTGEDVTAAHADIKAQVAALRTSVGRLRDFLKHSGSISALVSLEGQLSKRESELESTVAQQAALENQIALSTLTIQLVGPEPQPAKKRSGHGPSGFGTAIIGGWHGVVVSLRWVAAGLGYILPFVPLALLVGFLTALAIRRQRNAGNLSDPRQPDAIAEAATP